MLYYNIKMRYSISGSSTTELKEAFVARKMCEYKAGTIEILQFVTYVSYEFPPKEKFRVLHYISDVPYI